MYPWWRHQIETFSALLSLCAGNSPVTGEFTAQRPVTQSFDVFFDLCLNERLSKKSWGWWFETPSCPLWRHCNAINACMYRCEHIWPSICRYAYLYVYPNVCVLVFSHARIHTIANARNGVDSNNENAVLYIKIFFPVINEFILLV